MKHLHNEVLKTLLYYDIWHYPLTARELFAFLPVNSISLLEFNKRLREMVVGRYILEHDDYYFVRGKSRSVVSQRVAKAHHARKLWRMARISMHIIKRFPFVRAVFVSGELSKNATNHMSDVDFFIVTAPNRLWITRSLLIMFKKLFLLNKKKYFCLNYFATSDHLQLDDQNIFLASEIAHLKPLYNSALFFEYMIANMWIITYFPNFDLQYAVLPKVSERRSILQKITEAAFSLLPADKLDDYLLKTMEKIWAKRYPEYDDVTREKIFRSTKTESRAYVGNCEAKVLALYEQKLREFGIRQ